MPSWMRGPELLVILLVILVLFGAKRMPDAARGLGRSLRIFKAETRGLRDDDERDLTPHDEVRPSSLPLESRPYATEAELRARADAEARTRHPEPGER